MDWGGDVDWDLIRASGGVGGAIAIVTAKEWLRGGGALNDEVAKKLKTRDN